MNTERETFQHSEPWQDELTQLLAQPVQPDESINREGKIVGLSVTPHRSKAQPKVNLTVTLFSRYVSPLEDGGGTGNNEKLGVFLNGLQDADYHIRAAACEMLGQRAHPSARPALEEALLDENRYVRTAATQALTALDAPRVRKEELAGLRLILWQQVKHLWAAVAEARTNERGQAQFSHIPGDAPCRFQLLGQPKEARGPTGDGQGQESSAAAEPEMADALVLPAQQTGTYGFSGTKEKTQLLAPAQELLVAGGKLRSILSRNNRGQVVIEFRSDARKLWGVFCTVTSRRRKEQVLNIPVELKVKTRDIAAGSLILSDVLDLKQSYEIHVDPIPAPEWRE